MRFSFELELVAHQANLFTKDVFYNPDGLVFDRNEDGVEDKDDLYPLNPNESADSEGDGIGDNADDIGNIRTNPLDADSDDDSLRDGEEIELGLDPLDSNDCPDELCPQGSILLKLIPLLIELRADKETIQ